LFSTSISEYAAAVFYTAAALIVVNASKRLRCGASHALKTAEN